MQYFFTADCHFAHPRIIIYCKRPFKNVGEMDYVIIRNWNERVKPDDVVFHVGDFCFKGKNKAPYYEAKLNGKIIHIRGNHDLNNDTKTPILSILIHLGGTMIELVHNPADVDYNNKLAFVGHVHEHWRFKRIGHTDLVNVGVDQWDFRPININEILAEYGRWKRQKIHMAKNEFRNTIMPNTPKMHIPATIDLDDVRHIQH